MATLQNFTQDLPLFVETGLLAIKQGDEESAKKLFNAVGAIDPENTNRQMGYGLIAMHKMDLKAANKYFQEVLRKEPGNYRAMAFLGYAYVLSGVDEKFSKEEKMNNLKKATEIAMEVLEKCDTESTKELARNLLEWEKELEKKGGQLPPEE